MPPWELSPLPKPRTASQWPQKRPVRRGGLDTYAYASAGLRRISRGAPGASFLDHSVNESASAFLRVAFRFSASCGRFTSLFARFTLPLGFRYPRHRLAVFVVVRVRLPTWESPVGCAEQRVQASTIAAESFFYKLGCDALFFLFNFHLGELTFKERLFALPAGWLLTAPLSCCPDHSSANPGLLFHGTAMLQLEAILIRSLRTAHSYACWKA